ncbi:hypothetical protein SOVF_099050 [Spinacia oleracea]|nr:hypothetical protein SOVF_099050 [Spinacia oleracea]
MGILTVSVGVPKLKPPKCEPPAECLPSESWQLAILYAGLTLVAIGGGCVRPCNIGFGADQFDVTTEKGRASYARFYNWWYFSFTFALLVALIGVVWIQVHISWAIACVVATVCFASSTIIFLIGSPTFINKKPQGSIYIDMARVVVAAFGKRNVQNHQTIYDPPCISNSNDVIAPPKLSRTNRLIYLDKASLITQPEELNNSGLAINKWSLCSVQQVEQLKCLFGILPVWLTGVFCFVSIDQHNSYGILQAMQMNRRFTRKGFEIPAAWIGFASMASLSLWILAYERICLPLAKKITKKNDVRLSINTRIKIGIVMSVLSTSTAAVVECKRRELAIKNNSYSSPLHVGYLAPQQVICGLTEAFAGVTVMEFYTTQMPESMRSLSGSIFFLNLAMASYISIAIINIITKITQHTHQGSWLGGNDLNHNRLDYLFAIVACLGVVNYFFFTFFASKFVFIDNNIETTEAASSSTEVHPRVE